MRWWKNLKKSKKEDEEEFRKRIEDSGADNKDIWAMIISALLTFIPISLGVLLLLYLAVKLLFHI